MAHLELAHVDHALDDGRPLLNDVSLRVGDGAKVALVGPNGIGKTTLLGLLDGRIPTQAGSRALSGRFDRFLVLDEDGRVRESDEPVWSVGHVRRAR